MAAQGVTVASTVPIGRRVMPLPQLREKGVTVMTGTDSVIDHWSPFGTADMLEKANLCAQLYAGGDEFSLSRAMTIATGDILPLDDEGEQVWPKTGRPRRVRAVSTPRARPRPSPAARRGARPSTRAASFTARSAGPDTVAG